MNSTRFDLALHGAMIDHLESADFGEDNMVIMRDAEARLEGR